MKYVVATSDSNYFRWQMLVQINNFKKLGLLNDLTYVVSIENRRSPKLNVLEKETGVKIITYKDERKDKTYSPSLKHHMLKKLVNDYPEYGKCMFLIDPDVIFIKPILFNNNILKSHVWFLSDTKSYLNSKYIKSKGEKLFEEMCEIVNVEPIVVLRQDENAGGAQYIMKNVDRDFFEKVELDSVKLYHHMVKTSSIYSPEFPIQSWTAEMWSLIWNAWSQGHPTQIIDELNFCWATDPISNWDSNKIFHNAGVFSEKHLFNKTHFVNKTPFNEDFSYVQNTFCSKKYVNEILDTKKNYSKLINKI